MASVVATTVVSDADMQARPRRRAGHRLSNTELATMLRLIQEKNPDGTDRSNRQIALVMGCRAETVGNIRHTYADTTAESLAILRASAAGAARDWVKARQIAASEGKHQPAREQLEAVGAIHRQQAPGTGTTVVIVGVGSSGQKIGPDPWKTVVGVIDAAAGPPENAE